VRAAVRYRTDGGRTSRQREQSFGDDLKEVENFLLKVEHDKKAHVFHRPDVKQGLYALKGTTLGGLTPPLTYTGRQSDHSAADHPLNPAGPRRPR